MTEPYVPYTAQTYDISINLAGDTVSLVGLDQSEVMRFMSLMPKIYVTRYRDGEVVPDWVMTTHKGKDNGDNDK